MTLEISVWGARGSVPVGTPKTATVGCNTSCVMARSKNTIVIFDAGSGIVALGEKLNREKVKSIHLFISHPHYDHLIGLPFFAPLFNPEIEVTVHSPGANVLSTRNLVEKFMAWPFFPVSNEVFSANTRYETCDIDSTMALDGDMTVASVLVNHPGRTVAYRLEHQGKRVCYAPDFEHDKGSYDEALIGFLANADLAFLDCTYAPEEYEKARGFGHAHWRACGGLANRAAVKSWRIFHHQYLKTDDEIREIERSVQAEFPNAIAAREGDLIVI